MAVAPISAPFLSISYLCATCSFVYQFLAQTILLVSAPWLLQCYLQLAIDDDGIIFDDGLDESGNQVNPSYPKDESIAKSMSQHIKCARKIYNIKNFLGARKIFDDSTSIRQIRQTFPPSKFSLYSMQLIFHSHQLDYVIANWQKHWLQVHSYSYGATYVCICTQLYLASY